MRSTLFHRKAANYLFHISLYISIYSLAHYLLQLQLSVWLHRHQVVINKVAYTEIYSEMIFTFAPCMLLYLFYSNQLMHSF